MIHNGVRLISFSLSIILLLALSNCTGSKHSNDDSRIIDTAAVEGDHIVFLHLRMKNDSITLIDKSLQPGRLKQRGFERRAGQIGYEVISDAGTVLSSGGFDDPSVRRIEDDDPDHPGQLRTRLVYVDDAETTIRVPYMSSMTRVRFFKVDESGAVDSARQELGWVLVR